MRRLRDLHARCARATIDTDKVGLPQARMTRLRELQVARHAVADTSKFVVALAKLDNNAPVTDEIRRYSSTIVDAVHDETSSAPRLYYVQGRAGYCKTLCLNRTMLTLQSQGRLVGPSAYSGVAALNFDNGRTIHNLFGLSPSKEEGAPVSVTLSEQRRELLRAMDLIILDEISMADMKILEQVDLLLQDVMGDNAPFGGKTIVLAGDFLQLPPVVENGTNDDAVQSSVLRCHLWRHFQPLCLTRDLRHRDDPEFAQTCADVFEGALPAPDDDERRLTGLRGISKACELHDFVYPGIDEGHYARDARILAPTNYLVNSHNEALLARFPGPVSVLHGTDEFVFENEGTAEQTPLPPEVVASFRGAKGKMPPIELRLKKPVSSLACQLDLPATRLTLAEFEQGSPGGRAAESEPLRKARERHSPHIPRPERGAAPRDLQVAGRTNPPDPAYRLLHRARPPQSTAATVPAAPGVRDDRA